MDRRFPAPFSPFFTPSRRFFDDVDFDRHMIRPYWADQTMLTGHRVGDAIDVIDSDKEYNVSVDVSQFEPEELKVNIVDNQLIIEGKHAEKTDKYGQVERHFIRKYNLPTGVRPEQIKSELSNNGVLTVKYEKNQEQLPKSIPITIVPKRN
ncbi:Protein CBR-HSP-17 [Caenorhabditis briggsae]|uniref:SHSP domain-containing protein n=2 Tax=Caenorhabditis briggsae TaxID=6238 RepID=A0AAE9A3B6_CAEBR|nr:Protein CBR-HSP-17 [Caenorhabditis briggsae]ULT86133.1 hypothetical protein L3Y34_006076 [Caenorhabditis briggsae]UMM31889.1 hypothetical protein L5515_005909 [Caenorhabditis briggsae]CAP30666.1 Protein CBR-HSP-17 [Caenorhabditis briggsae]